MGEPTRRRVTRSEIHRMYSRPAQCSPLRRRIFSAGWTTRRSSSSVGVDIVLYRVTEFRFGQIEMFQDRVTTGSRPRRVRYRFDESGGIKAQIGRDGGKAVPTQGLDDLSGSFGFAAQMGGEGRAEPDLLAVLAVLAREEQHQGVRDLVAGPRARP